MRLPFWAICTRISLCVSLWEFSDMAVNGFYAKLLLGRQSAPFWWQWFVGVIAATPRDYPPDGIFFQLPLVWNSLFTLALLGRLPPE